MGDKKKKSPLGNRKNAPTWEENPHQDAPNYGTWDDQKHKWKGPLPEGLRKKIESDLNTSGTRKNYPKE